MAKHPHEFEKEIKAISPRTFGVDLTGASGYGIAADITGISNDFPHTNPRNGYIYDKLLREFFKNANNTVTNGQIHLNLDNIFPNGMNAGFTPNDYTESVPYKDFFEYDPSVNPMLATGVPLSIYSGHCVFFNSGKPYFHPNQAEKDHFVTAGSSPSIQCYSGGQTGFYRQIKLTGTKFNTAADKSVINSQGGSMRKVYLDNEGNGKFHDIFFRTQFTGNPDIGRRTDTLGHSPGLPHEQSFSRENLFNNFLDLGKSGVNGEPLATGRKYARTVRNNSNLKDGAKYRLLFTRVQNGKVIEHLQHNDYPISGISYLDLFEQNYDAPRLDGVHVHVFSFGKVMMQINFTLPSGNPPTPNNSTYKEFDQGVNSNPPGPGGRIDFSAFQLFTAKLD